MRSTTIHRAKVALPCLAALALTSAVSAQTETVLHNFIGASGYRPTAGVIADSSGNLYGTTSQGGSGAQGAIYELDRSGHYSELHDFTDGADGNLPLNGVARDATGNLYGATLYGGGADSGVIYKLSSGGQYTVLYTFTGGSDGGEPEGRLVLDASGNLYGTTYIGGAFSYGTVFELDAGGQFAVLHSFASHADGSYPVAGIVRDAAGNLYGTTTRGGIGGQGVVYKLDSNGQETILHSFSGGFDGGTPIGGVSLDRLGNLYGTTYVGGTIGGGVVYKLDLAGNETVLHNFGSSLDGLQPTVSLTFDPSGNLYGTTNSGGSLNAGTVFRIDGHTHQESVFYNFLGTDGGPDPNGPLLIFSGNIFGTALEGGRYGGGVLFEITSAP